MSNENELVILDFNKIITTPSSIIIFDGNPPPEEVKYVNLDIIVEQVIIKAREGDVDCQKLLKQITVSKFNNGELDELLDSDAVPYLN